MKNLKTWHYPSSVPEALELLANGRQRARVIAGGTALAESGDSSIEALIDITRISELRRIEPQAGGGVSIGATVTAREIVESDAIPPVTMATLGAAAQSISHRMHRNTITIGGNIVELYSWSDMPVALVALDARYLIEAAPEQSRWLEAVELTRQAPRKVLAWNEMLTRVSIPPPVPMSGGAFLKLSRTKGDYALATVATRVDLASSGEVSACRIVVGGAVPRPLRLDAVAGMLEGNIPDSRLLDMVASRVREQVTPRTDFRAGVDYRREVCAVLVKRALSASLEQARSQPGDTKRGRAA